MTDKKDPTDTPEPSLIGSIPRTDKVAQPRPLSLVAEEPAMLGSVPARSKVSPPSLGDSPAQDPIDEEARARAESDAENAEMAVEAAKMNEETEKGAAELASAADELRETVRALNALLDAMPK